jgi:hypothetical protein
MKEVNMSKEFTAKYNGQALLPDEPVDLETDTTYKVNVEKTEELVEKKAPENKQGEFYTVEIDGQQYQIRKGSVFDILWNMRGSIKMPADWSSQHDHYLYGMPKTEDESEKI